MQRNCPQIIIGQLLPVFGHFEVSRLVLSVEQTGRVIVPIMTNNVLHWLRRCRGGPSLVLLVAFILPILVALSPQQAIGAAADGIAATSPADCQLPVHHGGGKAPPLRHSGSCVLCLAGSPPASAFKHGNALQVPLQLAISTFRVSFAEVTTPRPTDRLTSLVPRGPPAA